MVKFDSCVTRNHDIHVNLPYTSTKIAAVSAAREDLRGNKCNVRVTIVRELDPIHTDIGYVVASIYNTEMRNKFVVEAFLV